MGLMEQAEKVTRVLTDQGTEGRIPLTEVRAEVSRRGLLDRGTTIRLSGRDRAGESFKADLDVSRSPRDQVDAMVASMNRSRSVDLDGRVFEGLRGPAFAVDGMRTPDREFRVRRTHEGLSSETAGLVVRARQVLRDDMVGQRRLGEFDKGLVTAAAEMAESLSDMGRRGDVSAARRHAVRLSKGPAAVEGLPLAMQMRMSRSSSPSR